MNNIHGGKRTWYKIKWIKSGRFDLFDDNDLEKNKDKVEVILTLQADRCASGVPLEFEKTEESKIDEWIKRNRK